jgi:hypothetical protein
VEEQPSSTYPANLAALAGSSEEVVWHRRDGGPLVGAAEERFQCRCGGAYRWPCQRGAQVKALRRHMHRHIAAYGKWMDKEEVL